MCSPRRLLWANPGRPSGRWVPDSQILPIQSSIMHCPSIVSCCKDLANQVWHSQSYVDSLKAVGLDRSTMKFLSIPAAEYFSGASQRHNAVVSTAEPWGATVWGLPGSRFVTGLPPSWTAPTPGVDASKLDNISQPWRLGQCSIAELTF